MSQESSSSSSSFCSNDELLRALWQGLFLPSNINAYRLQAYTCTAVIVLTFMVSTATKNYSQVDKIWSIIPVAYAWMAVVDARTLLMALVATVWGARLTWNFHRRGGYTWPYVWRGEEDYRWAEIQKGKFIPGLQAPIPWMIFNLTFVSFYQNVLLLLIASPSLVAYTVATGECRGNSSSNSSSNNGLETMDFVATGLVLLFVLVEGIADNQQYRFQTEKYRRDHPLTDEYAVGFCQTGLFAVLRKPNYAAEQAIWIAFYLFSVTATRNWRNWSAAGWILLCALFQGSAWFTELLTLQKYPAYAEYQKRVPLFIPNPLLLLGSGAKDKSN